MKKNIIYKQLIDYIKKGFPDYYYDNLSNDLIKNKIHAVSYFHRFKNKNPKFSRKLLQKLSNAANEAYNIVDRHIKTNNLESKVSPEVKKFINDNANAELIPQHEPIEDLLDELINGRKNKTKSSGWEYM